MPEQTRPQITIYTDGGARPNPGPGGWGARLIASNGAIKDMNGAAENTTNNRMELTAAVEALRALKGPSHVTLYTDSTYLMRGITEWLPGWVARNWQRKGDRPVQNQDLWQELERETRRHRIDWQWVKGHAGHEHNEAVDQLATAARQELSGEESTSAAGTPARPASSRDFAPDVEIALRVSAASGARRGGWAVRTITTGPNSQQHTLTGSEQGASGPRLELAATLAALDIIPATQRVRIICPSDYLFKGMTEWITGWRQRNWKTAGGKPVQNKDLWQALLAAVDGRAIDWVREGKSAPAIAQSLDKLAAEAARQR